MSSFDLGKPADRHAPSDNSPRPAPPQAVRERQQQGLRLLRRLGLFSLVAGSAALAGALGYGSVQELSAAVDQSPDLWGHVQRWLTEASAGSTDKATAASDCAALSSLAASTQSGWGLLAGPVPKVVGGVIALTSGALGIARGSFSTAFLGMAGAVALTLYPQVVLATLGC